MNLTPTQIENTAKYYSQMAKEPVTIEVIKGTMYVFGSELAALRIGHKMKTGRVEYSKNLKTWLYSKELTF